MKFAFIHALKVRKNAIQKNSQSSSTMRMTASLRGPSRAPPFDTRRNLKFSSLSYILSLTMCMVTLTEVEPDGIVTGSLPGP